ncbi:hypothetical protein PGT21_001521 [Puccinia graminis f. sp. tritici]|uniref:Uncharacterized protein n=1 Tax=Puccinia graminis f. sp. tritici TaxID=56615 RepID=A0A5B0LKW6_PUCGR|nr:hypothetical protein PGT21_001521 [Puccinia graminis f. sp. tritici]KAA1079936.1 hypothetical protein PGTUg99_007463 [Puccinia graminis f. sp. tritici]
MHYIIKKWSQNNLNVYWRDVFPAETKAQTIHGILDLFQSQSGEGSMKKTWLASNRTLPPVSEMNQWINSKQNRFLQKKFEQFDLRLKFVGGAIKLNDYVNLAKSHIFYVYERKLEISDVELKQMKTKYLKLIKDYHESFTREFQVDKLSKEYLGNRFQMDGKFISHILRPIGETVGEIEMFWKKYEMLFITGTVQRI